MKKPLPAPVFARILAAALDLLLIGVASAVLSFGIIVNSAYVTDSERFAICQENRSRDFAGCTEYRRQFESSQVYASVGTLALALLYLVGLPLIWGKTLGQATLGLLLQPESGKRLRIPNLLLQELPVLLYLSLQTMLVYAWVASDRAIREPYGATTILLACYGIWATYHAFRDTMHRFPHDIPSGTRTIVSDNREPKAGRDRVY